MQFTRIITESVTSSFGSTRYFFELILAGKIDVLDNEPLYEDPPQTAKPFKPHYLQYIFPHIKTFEQDRIAALGELKSRGYIAFPIGLAIIAAAAFALSSFTLSEGLVKTVFYGSIAAIAGLCWWTSRPVKKYKSSVKSIIFPNVFSFFGDDFKYSEQSLLTVHALKPSGLIPSYDNEYTEDYIRGSYEGVGIRLMEAKMTETRGSGKSRRTVTVFKGIFILLDMNKNFSGKTILKKDAGKIGNWFTDKFNKLENVALEDPVFEKQFEVYSNDQVEARYLLTTSFMERLLKLSDLLGSSGIQCSFYDDKLLLMVPSSYNRFETSSIYVPATFVGDINTILSEMKIIFEIIDILKLNQRIGL